MNIVQSTIQELAATIPGACKLFDIYKVDYALTPSLALKDVVWEGKNRSTELVDKLNELVNKSDLPNLHPWQHAPVNELIAHILENYHEKHRIQISDAIRQTQVVFEAHGDRPEFPTELEAHLSKMQFELEEHMSKEEEILFPMLARGMYPSGPIYVMESEHIDHAKALEHLRELTNDFSPPSDACSTWRSLYIKLQELYFDLKEHIRLENDVLFKENY